MANDVPAREVVRAEKSGRNIVSYTLSDGSVLSADEMRDTLLAGEIIGKVRVQQAGNKVWVRLRPTVPITVSDLVSTARTRTARKRQALQEQMAKGFAEELSELLRA